MKRDIFKRIILVFVAGILFLGLFLFFLDDSFYGEKKIKKFNSYNMNVSEKINLDNIYKNDDNDKKEVWSASNSNVEVVDNNVLVARKPGKAYVSVKKDDKELFKAKVNVLKNDDMAIDNHYVNLKLNQSKKIVVDNKEKDNIDKKYSISKDDVSFSGYSSSVFDESILYDDGNTSDKESYSSVVLSEEDASNDDADNYSFVSDNEDIVKVDDDGNLEAVGDGETIVTVVDEDGNEDFVHVVIDEVNLDLYTNEYNLSVGDTSLIEYDLVSDSYTKDDVQFIVDNDKVVHVVDGKIEAVGVGEAYVYLKVGNIEKQILVKVEDDIVLPQDIALSVDNVSIMVGEEYQISASVMPDDSLDKSLTWVSENNYVASVSNGVIVGNGVGNTIVIVTTVNGISKKINVNVKERNILVDKIYFQNDSLNMNVGDVKSLDYIIEPFNATDKKVKINYDNKYIEFDNIGNIKAIKSGNTKIEVISSNGLVAVLNVSILESKIDITGVSLDDAIKNIDVDDELYLMAKVEPSNTTDTSLEWSSSNDEIVKVDNNGRIIGVKAGEAVVSVKSKNNPNIYDECLIKVSNKFISLNKLSLNINNLEMKKGNVSSLMLLYDPINTDDKLVSWSSSDNSIATVDDNGKITALNAGEAIVTVKSVNNINIYDTCKVIVKDNNIDLVGIDLDKHNLNLKIGKSSNLGVIFKPADAISKSVEWFSSNSSIASVDSNGKVVANGVGVATITVKSKVNDSVKATCIVNVEEVLNGISLNKTKLNLLVGDNSNLLVSFNPISYIDKSLNWSSSNNKIVTVDNNGKVVAKGAGTAIITAKSIKGGKYASCKVIVKSIKVKRIKLNKSSITMDNGDSYNKLKYTITPSNATNKNVKWVSSNTKVVKVDNDGNIKAVGLGKAYVKVISKEKSTIKDKCLVKVESAYKKKFLDSLQMMSNKAKSVHGTRNPWRYTWPGADHLYSFSHHHKHNRKTSCVSLVAFGLMEVGVLKDHQYIQTYKYGVGPRGSGAKASVNDKMKFIKMGSKRINTLIKNGTLEAGDIVLYKSNHINVYAGNGKFYDAGRIGTNGCSYTKCPFKTFGPVKYPHNTQVYGIYRFKK